MSRTTHATTTAARLDETDVNDALLRMWAAGLARGAERGDVRKLAGGLLVVLDEQSRLRRAGRDTSAALATARMLLDGLAARGCVPPAAI